MTEINESHPSDSGQSTGNRRFSHELGGAGQVAWLSASICTIQTPQGWPPSKARAGIRGEQPPLTGQGADWE